MTIARALQTGELVQHLLVVEHAALEGRRVDLIDPQVFAEMTVALPPLVLEHGGRMVLDLMDLGVDAPVGRIRHNGYPLH